MTIYQILAVVFGFLCALLWLLSASILSVYPKAYLSGPPPHIVSQLSKLDPNSKKVRRSVRYLISSISFVEISTAFSHLACTPLRLCRRAVSYASLVGDQPVMQYYRIYVRLESANPRP